MKRRRSLMGLVSGLLLVIVGLVPTASAALEAQDGGNGAPSVAANRGIGGSDTGILKSGRVAIDYGRDLTEEEATYLPVSEDLTLEVRNVSPSAAGLMAASTPDGALTLEDSLAITPQYATRCREATAAYKAYNNAGHKLLEYRLNQYWCYNGTPVQGNETPCAKVFVTDLGAFAGWDWEGHVTAPFVNKRSSWYYRSYGQGEFGLAPIRVGVIQRIYPWIQIDTKGDGSYFAKWGRGA